MLEPSWAFLKPAWGHYEASLDHVEASWVLWDHIVAFWGHLRAILGSSWAAMSRANSIITTNISSKGKHSTNQQYQHEWLQLFQQVNQLPYNNLYQQ